MSTLPIERTALPSRSCGGVRASRFFLCGIALSVAMGPQRHTSSPQVSSKRPVTMADVIEMTRVANSQESNSWQEGVPAKSPDGKHVALVLRKGDLERNANVYSIEVLDTEDPSAPPKRLVSFSSNSNREGIKDLSWLADNDTIFFLGENPGEQTQLYRVRCSSGVLRKITSHPTNVTSYSASASGMHIVYAAEPSTQELLTPDVLRHGFHVPGNVNLAQLIAGHVSPGASDRSRLFLWREESLSEEPLRVLGRLFSPGPRLYLSPDGRHLIVKTMVREIKPIWRDYKDPILKMVMDQNLPRGSVVLIEQYEVLDTQSESPLVLLDAPIGYSGSELRWLPDSQSVLVTGVHLPLDATGEKHRKVRQERTFAAEVQIPSREIREISSRDLKLRGWDPRTNLWQFEARHGQNRAKDLPERLFYRRTAAGWIPADLAQTAEPEETEIVVEEDANTPPRIVVRHGRKDRSVLIDLNPQFASLCLAEEQEIRWHDTPAHEIRAGLYLPPGYAPGTRYPLVIQTHGYRPHEFWMDGPYTTAFAAQPLAAQGIVVLQLPELAAGTAEEGERNMRVMESAVDYLDRRGIIDRARVGVIGFSRTCYHVKYALTQSRLHFAAASVTEGVDAGYFQYMIFANESPFGAADSEVLVGAPPFGKGLSLWRKRSPGFLLNRVETPLEIQAMAPESLLTEWEWFSGLSRLGKPVDFVYIPTGTHILEKPWERMASQQTNVDWFVFWLKGEENPDPGKREQYARWRKLRDAKENFDSRRDASPGN